MTGKMLKINPLITQLLLIRRKSREFQPKFRHGIHKFQSSRPTVYSLYCDHDHAQINIDKDKNII